MKNTTAKMTMMKRIAGLILFPDEEVGDGEEEEEEYGERIGGLVIAPLLRRIRE